MASIRRTVQLSHKHTNYKTGVQGWVATQAKGGVLEALAAASVAQLSGAAAVEHHPVRYEPAACWQVRAVTKTWQTQHPRMSSSTCSLASKCMT